LLYDSQVILPLEQMYMFDSFYSPALSDSEFDSKPIVLLVGQYSTGKTSVRDQACAMKTKLFESCGMV
jgi:hypothetical protein